MRPLVKVLPMDEGEMIGEVLTILRGGRSFVLTVNGGTITAPRPISPGHSFVMTELTRMVECLRVIRESRDSFYGSIGSDVRIVIDEEYKRFVDAVASINSRTSSLLGILAELNGPVRDGLTVTTLICETLANSESRSIINLLVLLQDYGPGPLANITSRMINIGIEHILRFIRDWTVYGILDDPHAEFFVKKDSSKVEDEHWWQKKYTLVPDFIPKFLVDKSLVERILAAGKAHNFLRKFRASCIDYVKNFGSSAPFAVTFDLPKQPRIAPPFNHDFQLSDVPKFTNEAMKSLMYVMKTVIFITGHLKALQDFLLFGRGDFATLLYQNFTETTDGDPDTLLLHAIKSVTNSYRNKNTHECLTDRIDLHKKWTIQPKVTEISLVYLVNPPITTFLGKETLLRYNRVQRLIWKLKCSECQLVINWRNARRIRVIAKLGFDYRKVCLLRHLMVMFVRTIIEYLSTDVILVSEREMQNGFANCEDFDEMIAIHDKRMEKLMNGSFQSAGFSIFLRGLLAVLKTIGEFLESEESVEDIFRSIIEQFENNADWKRKDDFIVSVGEELSDAVMRVKDLHKRFCAEVNEFYATISQSVQVPGLSTRLQWSRGQL
jgi:hypothetical protein